MNFAGLRNSAFSLMLLISALPAWAAINAYHFDDPAEEQRFRNLIEELRCPKCQNQTIADSNAPLSQDLRQRVYEMIQAGRSNAEIIEFMVARYGNFITYRPPFTPLTWGLWLSPLVLIALAASALAVWLRKRRTYADAKELDTAERERLQALLGDDK